MADAWKAYKHLPDMPTEVYADPGRHYWYFREKKPDSVAKFIRSDLTPPAEVVEAMELALQSISDLTTLSATDFADKHPDLNAKLDARLQEHWYDVLSSHADAALAALTAWKDAQ